MGRIVAKTEVSSADGEYLGKLPDGRDYWRGGDISRRRRLPGGRPEQVPVGPQTAKILSFLRQRKADAAKPLEPAPKPTRLPVLRPSRIKELDQRKDRNPYRPVFFYLREPTTAELIDYEAIAEAQRAVDEFLAKGGKVTLCPTKERKYVFSEEGRKRADALRKKAKRGDAEALEELSWWRQRALPKPYVPKAELACDADSISGNFPGGTFEDRFLDSLENGGEPLWGDVFEEALDRGGKAEDEEVDDHGERSADAHELVGPDYTNSLDRLFGQEVDHKRLNEDTLKGASADFRKAWNDVLSEARKAETKERDAWHALIKCPS